MMTVSARGEQARLIDGGKRLHLHYGPIDLVIGAEATNERPRAFEAARQRFTGLLDEIVAELPCLRLPLGATPPRLRHAVPCRMLAAAWPHAGTAYVTPMIAVAGAVADEILAAICAAAPLTRAYVNNGGDIALHLAPGRVFDVAMASVRNADLGRVRIVSGQGIGGIATSGHGGRSHSLGIADSVTVLARSAADADAAATLVANAVDLPGHPAIRRVPASALIEDSDLDDLPVVTHVPPLPQAEVAQALEHGRRRAAALQAQGIIAMAALFLQGQSLLVTPEESAVPSLPEAQNV